MSKIFVHGRKSMKFFMKECPERKNTAGLIEKHGGKMVKTREPDTVELVPFDVNFVLTQNVSQPVYSYNLVKDSVSLKQVQDLREYRMSRLTSAKRVSRKPYRSEDELKMKNYVDTHAGNPAVVKFWEDALKKGLDLDHTADSLRHHWTKVLPRKNAGPSQVTLPFKRKANEENVIIPTKKKYKEEKVVIPDEDEMKSIRVVIKDNKRNIVDFNDVNVKCEEEEIDKKFELLVDVCSSAAKRRVSKQEVLRALVARNGVVKNTIDHFSQ